MTFADFWAAWPSNTRLGYSRKGGRRECEALWKTRGYDSQAEEIIAHVEYLKTTEDWTKQGGQFIPAPVVYLRQARWDGAEIPETPEQAAARIRRIEAEQIQRSIRRVS